MLVGFIIAGFIFFVLSLYFVVLILFPEWVGVSGRDHQKFLEEQREQDPTKANTDEPIDQNQKKDVKDVSVNKH